MKSKCTVALMLLAAAIVCAQTGPQPPCGGQPSPPYPEVDAPPVVQVWDRSDWTPPACTGLGPSGSPTVVATVARFRSSAGMDALRRKIGAISQMSGMLYWSTSHQRWQPLIASARALAGPAGDKPRQDFTLDELVVGRSLYLEEEDDLLGKAAYRLRIVNLSGSRLVFAMENSSAIRAMGIPLFQPGEVQAIYFLERGPNQIWRYYGIARTSGQATMLMRGHEASLINRAVAFYRYLAGIPLDREPPAAR